MARWTKALPILALLAFAPTALAYHVPPWDTGHQSFNGDPGIQQTDPGATRPCGCGSPVEVATGNFIHGLPQLAIPGLGPDVDLTLVYNSQDLRKGAFGTGWTHAYEERLVVTTDGSETFAIYGRGLGKRDRFVRNGAANYTAPPGTFLSVFDATDGTRSVRDKNGTVRQFDADGKLIRITDRNANSLSVGYDSAGFLATLTDAAGRITRFVKGANGRVASVTDPANRTFHYSYDAGGRLLVATDPLGLNWSFEYESHGLLSIVRDPKGNIQTRIQYDDLRRVSRLTEKAETWTYSYAEGQTTKEDSHFDRWVYDYNDAGSITKVNDPLNGTVSYAYDAQLNIVSITDENFNLTRYTYDSSGNMLTITDALGNVRRITYEPTFNQPTSFANPTGDATVLQYDARGNIVSITDPSGAAIGYLYDAKGQVTRETDAGGGVTTLTYDQYGNIVGLTSAGKSAEAATFDLLGNLLTSTDARGMTYRYAYDLTERLISVTDPANGVTTRQYDDAGNLTVVTLPNGAVFRFAYDSFNRLATSTNPVTQSAGFVYDSRDNVISSTDALNRTIRYEYDALGRLVTKITADDTVRYEYDAAGNLLTVANAGSTVSFAVDALNRVIRTQASPMNVVLSYAFDSVGRLQSIDDGSGGTIAYGYNRRSMVTSISDSDGFVANLAYDSRRRRTRMDRTGGFSSVYTFDAADRLVSLAHASPAGPLTFSYAYDQGDNRVSMTSGGTHAYNYNRRDYLTAATHPTTANPVESYSYDPVGNRLTSHLSGTYSYDAANRQTADARFDYLYDADGNLVQRRERASGNVRAYTYDAENSLIKIVFVGGSTATYKYDGLGRRYEKNVDGEITRYVYSGTTLLKELDKDGDVTARYTPGVLLDEMLAVRRNGVTSVIEVDGVGSVVRTVSGAQVNSTAEYDSFGRFVSQTGTLQTSLAFQGREYDAESRLYYFRARYYDPQSARFLTEDPLGLDGGVNLYMFAQNNPFSYIDPFGLTSLPVDGKPVVKDEFGVRSKLRNNQPHSGIDLANPLHGVVRASDSGKVIESGRGPSGANQVRILNDDGSVSGYAHVTPSCKFGDVVKEGDPIGKTDVSGRSTGPHLHYTFRPTEHGPLSNPRNHLGDLLPARKK